MINQKKAARHQAKGYRAIVEKNDNAILAAYDRYTLIAGAIIGAAFGLMVGVGL